MLADLILAGSAKHLIRNHFVPKLPRTLKLSNGRLNEVSVDIFIPENLLGNGLKEYLGKWSKNGANCSFQYKKYYIIKYLSIINQHT